MFAVGLVVGSGLTVCIMRRNVQRLEEYVELLRREVRRLRIVVDDHLALFDGAEGVYSNSTQVLSYPTSPPALDPAQTSNGSTLPQTAQSTPPHPHQIHHRRQSPHPHHSPHRQTSRSSSRPSCPLPPPSPPSNSDGEEHFSMSGR